MPQTHKKEKFYALQPKNWQPQIEPHITASLDISKLEIFQIFHSIISNFCLNILSFAGGAE